MLTPAAVHYELTLVLHCVLERTPCVRIDACSWLEQLQDNIGGVIQQQRQSITT